MNIKRLEYVDFAKGIAILLVIFGHSLKYDDLCRAIIFSFHLPLFFVCSGITQKQNYYKEKIGHRLIGLAKKTLLPAFCIYLIYILYDLISNWDLNSNWIFVKKKMLSAFFALGENETVRGVKIEGIGMLWFLITFFIAQLIYLMVKKYAKDKLQIVIIVIITVVGFAIGRIVFLPFDIDIAMVMTAFILSGYLYRKSIENRISNLKLIILSFAIWLLTFLFVYLLKDHYLMASERSFPLFPISLITAFAGTVFLLCVGKRICDLRVATYINYIGKYSMRLFIIHTLDRFWNPIIVLTNNRFINGIIRVVIDVIIFLIVTVIINRIKVLKNENRA